MNALVDEPIAKSVSASAGSESSTFRRPYPSACTTSPPLTIASPRPGTCQASMCSASQASRPSSASPRSAPSARVSVNGNSPGPCRKSPEIVAPSLAISPRNVGSPGIPSMAKTTESPAVRMPVSGRSSAPCWGMSMVPVQAPASSRARSTVTPSGLPGISIWPRQVPAGSGASWASSGGEARVAARTSVARRRRTAPGRVALKSMMASG